MTVPPEFTVAIVTGIGILTVGLWKNRTDIRRLLDAIFGHERENGGLADEHDSIDERLERLEDKIDEQRQVATQRHAVVEREIRTNRYLLSRSFDELVVEINRKADQFELEGPDTSPGPLSADDRKWRGGSSDDEES